jgi:hypothetical protein
MRAGVGIDAWPRAGKAQMPDLRWLFSCDIRLNKYGIVDARSYHANHQAVQQAIRAHAPIA